MRRIALAVGFFAFVLAGCSGARSVHSTIPSVQPDGNGVRAPQSSNYDRHRLTLWYGDAGSLRAVPNAPGGLTAEIDVLLSSGSNRPSFPQAMNVSIDSTVYDLINVANCCSSTWTLQIFAPGSTGPAAPEQFISGGPDAALQVLLAADGIDVLATDKIVDPFNPTYSLYTYGFAAGNNPAPIRTLPLGTNVVDVASDGHGRLYVARRNGQGISVYPAGANGATTPIRTIATGLQVINSIAVAADNTVYIESNGVSQEQTFLYAYAPGNDGPRPSRLIGGYSAASRGAPTGGITVDADGNLYAGFTKSNVAGVDVFAPNANGPVAPLRTIATPTQTGTLTSIVVGKGGTQRLPPAPLYVGSNDLVNVFPATANGAVTPQRTITSVFSPAGSPAGSRGLVGTASGAAGSLLAGVVAQPRSTPTSEVDLFLTSSFGAARPQQAETVNGAGLIAIARVPGTPNYDVLAAGSTPDGSAVVEMFPGQGPATGQFNTAPLPPHSGSPNSIAVDASANIYVSNDLPGEINVYAPGSTGTATPIRTFSPSKYAGPLAIGPDGTLYVRTGTFIQTSGWFVQEFAPGATSPSRTLGPFSAVNGASPGVLSALAVDAQNHLYLAFNRHDAGGTTVGDSIEVFAPGASGTAAPLRIIKNPIAPGDPNGPSILSIAIGS